MQKLLSILKKTGIGIIGLLFLYLCVALILSFIPTNPERSDCKPEKVVFVASNGVHLDIIIPTAYLTENFLHNVEAPEGIDYLAFGWGDKEFYVNTPDWNDIKIGVTLRALFMNTPSVLHVGYYRNRFSHWAHVDLCEHQFQALINYIKDEFKVDSEGHYISVGGYGPNDRFFDARGNLVFYRTCNIWVNQGLKKAEIKTSIWSPFDFGVLYHLKEK
jgi:uncharacterized protein (TIGR02117 family)